MPGASSSFSFTSALVRPAPPWLHSDSVVCWDIKSPERVPLCISGWGTFLPHDKVSHQVVQDILTATPCQLHQFPFAGSSGATIFTLTDVNLRIFSLLPVLTSNHCNPLSSPEISHAPLFAHFALWTIHSVVKTRDPAFTADWLVLLYIQLGSRPALFILLTTLMWNSFSPFLMNCLNYAFHWLPLDHWHNFLSSRPD